MKYAQQGDGKIHVVRENTGVCIPLGYCGAELHGDEYPARAVPVLDRCQATGCKQAWPAFLRAVG